MGFTVEDAGAMVEMILKAPDIVYRNIFRRYLLPATDEVMKALFVDGIKKIVYTGCFSYGKTFDQPPVAQMWIWAYLPDSIVIPGAPKMEQSLKHFWVEYRKMYDELPDLIGGTLNDLSGEWRSDIPGCYIKSMAPGKRKTAAGTKAYTGYGTHNEYVLYMGDDAQGVETPTYEAVNNAVSTGGSAQIWYGNPAHQGGMFFDMAQKTDCLHIVASALDHPNIISWMQGKPPVIPAAIAGSWVDEMVFEHCSPVLGDSGPLDFQWFEFRGRVDETGKPHKLVWFKPDPWFVGNVLGQFPDISANSLVSYADAHAACHRTATPLGDPVVCGLDPAEFGTDETVFDFRYETVEGIEYHEQKVFPGRNEPVDILNLARQYLNLFPHMKLYGDAIGVGSGVMSVLTREYKGRAFGIKWSPKKPVRLTREIEKKDPHNKYADFRTQLQTMVSYRFRSQDVAVKKDTVFISQACSVKKEINSRGKVTLESKISRKENLDEELASPDRWEALCYSYCGDLLNLTTIIKRIDPRVVQSYRTAEARMARNEQMIKQHRTANRAGRYRETRQRA